MSRHEESSTWKNGAVDFVAGSLGGVALVYVGQPLDTVKVKMQTYPHLYVSMVDCCKKVWRDEGLVKGLYAGTIPAILANVAENSVLFACYGFCQRIMAYSTNTKNVEEMSVLGNASAGCLASFFSSFTLCPTELLKIRLQAAHEEAKKFGNKSKVNLGLFGLTKEIICNEGIFGMFKGFGPTVAREMPGYFVFFGGYEATRTFFAPAGKPKEECGALATMVAGGVGGLLLWTVIFPFDVVKSRIQASSLQNNINMVTQMTHILKNEGSYLSNILQNTLKKKQEEIYSDTRTFKPVVRIKEPKCFLNLPREIDCVQQSARWPVECQVIEDKIHHIEYNPPYPEEFYVVTGSEIQPNPVGEEAGTVVFQYYPMSAVNYFSRSCVGGNRFFLSSFSSEKLTDLKFESRFESGNLAKAVKISDSYYELYLRTDLYTNRHMQWFYFRISNMKANVHYRFSIVNLSKSESLYSMGMKPLMYSTKDAEINEIGWRRCGENITYFRNDLNNGETIEEATYTLSFNLTLSHNDDEVYLAHCYPYTYSDLQDYLHKLQNHPVKSTFSSLRLLCRSLAGNSVYYLTITAPNLVDDIPQKKKAIVITSRVHPGETPSSWMMKGFLDFLTGDSTQAKELRRKFIFKLIPMLNPDGVIVGNNRCSLIGRDLNRQYRTVIRETYPPVWHTKLLIRRLMEECGVLMYCDLHAHSRKHNVFIYGCENKQFPDKRLQEQIFPLMLHKNAADKFCFENCKFRVQKSKEGTSRVVAWMMGIMNSYTMEASFGGSSLGNRNDTHFSIQDFEMIGRTFCETLLDFYDEHPSKERLRCKIINRLVKEGSSADEPTNIDLSDYSSDEGDENSSSEEESCTFVNLQTSKFMKSLPNQPFSTQSFRILNDLKLRSKVHEAVIDIHSEVTTDSDSDYEDGNTAQASRKYSEAPTTTATTATKTTSAATTTAKSKINTRSTSTIK